MVQRLRISVSASALTAVLLLAFTAAAQSRPSADETYTYSISAEGIPLETLVHHAEQATGKSFVYSEQSGLKGKKVLMIGTARVPRAEAFSLFQGIFVSQGYALIPFGDERNNIMMIEAIEGSRSLKQRAPFVFVDNLPKYKNEVGQVIMTSIPLKYVGVANVRAAVSQMLQGRTVEFVQEVQTANSLVVVGFAPTVCAVKQLIDAMDVPQTAVTLKFEIIGLQHAVAEELTPIIENLIKTEATPGRARTQAMPEGGLPGVEKPEPKIIADPRTNALVVYAVESDMNEIKRLVAALDTEVKNPESNIHIYMLKNTNAADLVDTLREFLGQATGARGSRPTGIQGQAGQQPRSSSGLGQDVTIVADRNNNALLLTASKTRYAEVLPLIEKLDQRRPQVLVQAAIAELSDSDLRNIGAEITALAGGSGDRPGFATGFGLSTITTTSTGGTGSSTTPNISNLARVPFLSGNTIDFTGGAFGIFDDDLNVPVLIRMLKQNTRSNLVSVPSVLTNDNQDSKIEVSKQVATTQFNTSTAGTDSTSFSGYQEAKVELVISPHISNDNYLRMEVALTVEAFVGQQVNSTIPPDKTRRRLEGNITVQSGKTVIIGGLVQDNDTEIVSAVPFLSDIPLLGELFKNTDTTKEKVTLYVFMTPTILNGFDDLDAVSYERKMEVHKLEGQMQLIDPNFRPTTLDDVKTPISYIESSGNLDLPRYAPVNSKELKTNKVDGDPNRPIRPETPSAAPKSGG